jgi:hypothetical protein
VLALIGDRTGVTFEIEGDALKDAGFTKNMRQNLSLGRVTASEILFQIVVGNIPPVQDKKLCFVIDDTRNSVLLTTEAFARAAGQKIFRFKAAAANADATAAAGAANIFQRKDVQPQ